MSGGLTVFDETPGAGKIDNILKTCYNISCVINGQNGSAIAQFKAQLMNSISTSLRAAGTLFALAASLAVSNLSADTVIDTNPTWDGNVNSGWAGSGNSLTVPTGDDVLSTFTAYAADAAAGQTFTLDVDNALNGGTVLFSTSFLVATGANTVTIDQAYTPGSEIFVEFDYNGYTGQSLDFSYANGYSGGNAAFGGFGSEDNFPGASLRFIADFTGGSSSVPDAGDTSVILGLGLAGLAAVRSKFRT